MTMMIQLPNTVAATLRKAAKRRQISPDVLAAQLIEDALTAEALPAVEATLTSDVLPSLEQLVAKIQGLPRDPRNIRPATASLKELLENAPEDPEFDLDEWQRQWDMFEEEVKDIERADRERDKLEYYSGSLVH